jgi:hypothetical protein
MVKRFLVAAMAAAIVVTSAGWAAAQGKASGTLTADDYAEITQLYAKYNFAIDSGDGEAWAATFTPDGVFGKTVGHDALVAFVADFQKRMEGRARHWNSNVVITPTAEGANGGCYLLLFNTGVKPAVPTTSAKYDDKLVKTAQGWRFKSRTVVPDAPPKPASQE